MRLITLILCLAVAGVIGCKKKQPQYEVLPGRHLSESQVLDLAALPPSPDKTMYRVDFKDGTWEISLVQLSVWGTSSAKTNADGRVEITKTNSSQVVARIRDVDKKVEVVK